ncbi:uncharacterized protein LOC135830811 [Sycon ciliatum]|uniref:uncharacterized protein LOC135830811 n=1 Tax=Sycon ciliatum TaxID=27933 RepID=UPI0020AC79C8
MSLRRTPSVVQGWSYLKNVEWLAAQKPSSIVSTLRPPSGEVSPGIPMRTLNTSPGHSKSAVLDKTSPGYTRMKALQDQLEQHREDMQKEHDRLNDVVKSLAIQLRDVKDLYLSTRDERDALKSQTERVSLPQTKSRTQERQQTASKSPQAVKRQQSLPQENYQQRNRQHERMESAERYNASSNNLQQPVASSEDDDAADIKTTESKDSKTASAAGSQQFEYTKQLTYLEMSDIVNSLNKHKHVPEETIRGLSIYQLVQIIFSLKKLGGGKEVTKSAQAALYVPLHSQVMCHSNSLPLKVFLNLVTELLSWGRHDPVLPRYAMDIVFQRHGSQQPLSLHTLFSLISLLHTNYNSLYKETTGKLVNQLVHQVSAQSIQNLPSDHVLLLGEVLMSPSLAKYVNTAARRSCLHILLVHLKSSHSNSRSLSIVSLRWDLYNYLHRLEDT